MSNQGYYRLTMHEYGARTYHCHGKYYFCTLHELSEFAARIREHPETDPDFEEDAAHIGWLCYKTFHDEWDDAVDGECPLVPVEMLYETRAFYAGDKLDAPHLMRWRTLCQ